MIVWQKSRRFAIRGMIQKFAARAQIREICDCREKKLVIRY